MKMRMPSGIKSRAWLIVIAAVVVAAVLYLVLVMARGLRPPVMASVYRFVDPALRANAVAVSAKRVEETSRFPVGDLLEDTRFVLTPLRHAGIFYTERAVIPGDVRVSIDAKLPPALEGAERIAVAPQIHLSNGWTRLPDFVVATEPASSERHARFTLTLPDDTARKTIGIQMEAYAISGGTTVYRTGTVTLPPHAALGIGFGIKRLAWSQGPVRFDVETCANDRCDPLFSETLDPSTKAGHGWHDRSVSLETLAGQARSFLFTTRVVSSDPKAFSLSLWANPTVYVRRPRQADERNVIVLSIDTLAARHMTTYGYAHDTAPFIDETFGKHGTVFEHCIAPATTTGPSHMSLFTSVAPGVHRVGTETGSEVLPSWLVTMAEVFRAAGFDTAAVTEDGWLSADNGFARGFNSYAENKSPDLWEPKGQVALTFAKAKRWLTLNRDKRFFLFLHTYQVHSPYVAPHEYDGLFADHDGNAVTAASPRYLRDQVGYDREIRYCDDQLRLLFQTIKELGLDSNTIFVLLSDHGEEFLEHGRLEHGAQVYEEVTHVALMFWGPGTIPQSRRLQGPVSLIDVMPTLLELSGADIPHQNTGISLIDPLLGKSEVKLRPLVSEAWAPFAKAGDGELVPMLRPGYLAQVGMKKLMRYRGETGFRYEYYDLAEDADEHTNLYANRSAEVEDLRARLDAYENDCKSTATTLASAREQGPVPTPGHSALNPEQQEKLRALGYIQ